jgi:hypothetical protein
LIDLKKLKQCPKCNLKFYNLYVQLTIEYHSKDDCKRKWKLCGKICKNRHYIIDESSFDFKNCNFNISINKRVIYLKTTFNNKQKFKRIGNIFTNYRIVFDDMYYNDFYYHIPNVYYNEITNLPEIFFYYPIEKREKLQSLKIFDIKYGIEKRISKSRDFDIKN